MRINVAVSVAVTALVLSACGATSSNDTPIETPATASNSTTTAAAPSSTSTSLAETTTTAEPRSATTVSAEGTGPVGGSITGVAPDLVIQEVFAAAEALTGLDRVDMTLMRAQAVTWSDGSLGCPEPGVGYTQALVDGYWVQLEVENSTLDYRVTDRGHIQLCERPAPDPGQAADQ